MFRNIFGNLTDVVKNLLILNVLFFLATFLFQNQGIYLKADLGSYYPGSPNFKPYQIVTHFFMHADFRHILFNMFGLIFMGPMLENYWGKKRFVIFYFVTALGAWFFHFLIQGIEIHNLTGEWFPNVMSDIQFNIDTIEYNILPGNENYRQVAKTYLTPVLGASGAIYGLLMAFAMLFPNTEFRLLFPPIALKAKWFALILGVFALYQGYENSTGDSIAHFAHLGGMIFGFIMIKIWQKDRSNFY